VWVSTGEGQYSECVCIDTGDHTGNLWVDAGDCTLQVMSVGQYRYGLMQVIIQVICGLMEVIVHYR